MTSTRRPRQKRAQKTVEAIVTAGFNVIASEGNEGFSTRRIAECAGVGIGSVYEYFADKQAIRDAMREQMLADLLQVIRTQDDARLRLPPPLIIRELLQSFREFLRANDGRYAAFVAHLHPRELDSIFPALSSSLSQFAVQYALNHPELVRVPRIPVISYIAIHGGLAVIRQHLSEASPRIAFDDLAAGLADMVDGMLRDQPSPS